MDNKGSVMDIETRTIGKTDISVTKLGFGGAPLGAVGDYLNPESVNQILDTAWDGGIRYFDTAPLYGHGLSEKRLGGYLSNKTRDDFVLSSKVGRLLVPEKEGERFAGMRDHEPVAIQYDFSASGVRRSLEDSLTRLGLDRVDILLCHDIDTWTHHEQQPEIYRAAAEGALPEMHRMREEGLVRAIGLGVNESAVCTRVLKEFDPNCFLLAGRFTLLEQEPLDEMLPLCLDRNVSVIIGGPYNSGLLTNVERRRATYDYKPVPDDLWDRAQEIKSVCQAHSTDIRAAALQYPLQHQAVAAVIPGVISVEETNENLELVNREIPESLWIDLAENGLLREW